MALCLPRASQGRHLHTVDLLTGMTHICQARVRFTALPAEPGPAAAAGRMCPLAAVQEAVPPAAAAAAAAGGRAAAGAGLWPGPGRADPGPAWKPAAVGWAEPGAAWAEAAVGVGWVEAGVLVEERWLKGQADCWILQGE